MTMLRLDSVTDLRRLRDVNGQYSTGENRGNNGENPKAKLVNNAQKIKSLGTKLRSTNVQRKTYRNTGARERTQRFRMT